MSETKSYTLESSRGLIEYREPIKSQSGPFNSVYRVSMNYVNYPDAIVLCEGKSVDEAIKKAEKLLEEINFEMQKFL